MSIPMTAMSLPTVLLMVAVLAFSCWQNLDEFRRIEAHLIKRADKYKAFIKPLLEFGDVHFFTSLEIVAYELPACLGHFHHLFLSLRSDLVATALLQGG